MDRRRSEAGFRCTVLAMMERDDGSHGLTAEISYRSKRSSLPCSTSLVRSCARMRAIYRSVEAAIK